MNFIKIKNYIRIKVLKLLYINFFNKNFKLKLYIYKIIKIFKKINKIKKKNIKKYIKKKKKYLQYEEKEIIKYIFLNFLKRKKKFNIFKNKNIKFLFLLFKKTKEKDIFLNKLIQKNLYYKNIKFLNIIDLFLLKMAICEFFFIKKDINIKIIIYEYINISKIFSSYKSKNLINGILDKIFKNEKF
ncbi:MAG: hypothetical protein NHG09_00255 [Candidatus Shikimatogenerans sp. JK-2022]|nr:hypothetical protein [Candidatus Shikimatogenerans bostrichidophilus]